MIIHLQIRIDECVLGIQTDMCLRKLIVVRLAYVLEFHTVKAVVDYLQTDFKILEGFYKNVPFRPIFLTNYCLYYIMKEHFW